MSSSSLKSPPVMSDRTRRLVYQASYTGMKETDLLLGHFAKTHLADLCDADLTDFENLLAAGEKPSILLTTISAGLQKQPPAAYFADSSMVMTPGSAYSPKSLAEFLTNHAYLRTDTVRETGEFAIRGGIVDVFPPGHANPVPLVMNGLPGSNARCELWP